MGQAAAGIGLLADVEDLVARAQGIEQHGAVVAAPLIERIIAKHAVQALSWAGDAAASQRRRDDPSLRSEARLHGIDRSPLPVGLQGTGELAIDDAQGMKGALGVEPPE